MDDRSLRICLVIAVGRTRYYARWCFKFQHTKNGVIAVGAHVAEGAAAEVGPAAPGEWQVHMIKGKFGSRPKPEVPIKTVRDRFSLFRPFDSLWPERTARP